LAGKITQASGIVKTRNPGYHNPPILPVETSLFVVTEFIGFTWKRRNGRVVSNFIVQALRNEPITVYGEGTQTRSFCYVDDLVDGLIRLMNSADELIGPVNLGNPVEISMAELALLVIKLTGTKSAIIHGPLPADDPVQRQPDISLAQETLLWKPVVSLEEGVQRTIDDLKSRI
jgi:UDP-glucuronate decarboxylase